MKVPKYYQVKSGILDLIVGLPPGTAIPTERELAAQFETSRTTVRQAIAELVVDGRLERAQGRGTFVAHPKLMQVRQLTSFSQDLSSEGWVPGSIVIDVATERACAEWARAGRDPRTVMEQAPHAATLRTAGFGADLEFAARVGAFDTVPRRASANRLRAS